MPGSLGVCLWMYWSVWISGSKRHARLGRGAGCGVGSLERRREILGSVVGKQCLIFAQTIRVESQCRMRVSKAFEITKPMHKPSVWKVMGAVVQKSRSP